MKKVLGGASALALILGLSVPAMAADYTVGKNSLDIDATAISVNSQDQSVLNEVHAGEEIIDNDALYDARMLFGNRTFDVQDVDVNNFNSGINAAQQGAVSIAVSAPSGGGHGGHGASTFGGGWGGGNDCECGAVALNDLDQEVANIVGSYEAGIDDGATYDGRMNFGNNTFGDQDLTVNNFNTGWNAAQQGGVAIAAATGSVGTAQ